MEVLFSSWNNEVIDNRGMEPGKRLNAPAIKLPKEFDPENRIGAFMGWAGIILLADSVRMADMCLHYVEEAGKASCGKCFPCRMGTEAMATILRKIVAGQGDEQDLNRLAELADYISMGSKCYIGKTVPIPIQHALRYFKNEFMDLIHSRKPLRTDTRYAARWTAPCYSACPAGMDIPGFVECIHEGNHLGSLKIIREASPMAASLGRACFHPCETNCRRGYSGKPVSICKLKRFAWDFEDTHPVAKPGNPAKSLREEKVAVIGAGPAGLSAAYYLALMGYRVTVFESLPVSGGMVGVGIPQYRVPKEVLQREVDFVRGMGVEIRYDTPIGKELTIPMLRDQGYQAVLISIGAHISKKMGAKGEDEGYEGFITGVDYLRDCVISQCYDLKDKRIVVVGGGNVAMDCCRTPIRKGAAEVTVVYRRTKKELPADPHEVHDSEIEGVKYLFLAAPKQIIAEDGKVVGMECIRMELGEPDASGRRSPREVKGSEFVVPADIIIQAIGQESDLTVLNGVEGVQLTRWKTIVADPDTYQTHVPWIFTAGDVYSGPLTIVDACAHGKRAAESIDQYLNHQPVSLSAAEKMDKLMRMLGVEGEAPRPILPSEERVPMPTIPLEERVGSLAEIETGYTLPQALEEASRCLRCYQMGMVALEKGATAGS
ncbi:MAG: FAD-dependent oxidoreductase [Thermodesulfobacteriota bacterium]